MTTVGHALTGLALGVLCVPRAWRWRRKAALLAAFALLANIPDIKILWACRPYDIRHSLPLNAALILPFVAVAALWPRGRQAVGGWSVIVMGAAAWLSHLLLDAFYKHHRGVAIWRPFSKARLDLAIPWFATLRSRWRLDGYSVRIAVIELAFYGTLLGLCVAGRWWYERRRTRRRPKAAGL